MNKGITSKQVEEALGMEGQSVATVSEWEAKGALTDSAFPIQNRRATPHRYEVVIDGDMDISMAELQALVALFGTTHVCGRYTAPMGVDCGYSCFYYEVSE